MRGPSLVRMLKERYIIVVLDKKDKVIVWATSVNSKEAAKKASFYKKVYEKQRVSVYKLTPCRY